MPFGFKDILKSRYKKEPKLRMVDSVLKANQSLDFVKRLYEKKPQTIMLAGETSPSTHMMASAEFTDEFGKPKYISYPTIVRTNGKLIPLDDEAAYQYARKTKEFVALPTEEDARFFAEGGYKKGKNVKIGKLSSMKKR